MPTALTWSQLEDLRYARFPEADRKGSLLGRRYPHPGRAQLLAPQETEKLFTVLRNMRDAGKAIVITTHKVESLSDRLAILNQGRFVGDMLTKNTNAREMTNMMVGRPVDL